MTSIRGFKKNDWVCLSMITCDNDDKIFIEEKNQSLFLLFKTNTKCIMGRIKDANLYKYKYWFEIAEEDLIDVNYITRQELIDMFDNYDLEIHKYKLSTDKYWQDYIRSKRDFNWKYNIAIGINVNWTKGRKKLLDSYLEDLKKIKLTNNKDAIKFEEEALTNFLTLSIPEVKCKGTFQKGFGLFGTVDFNKNETYFDAMLNNYAALKSKYGGKVDDDIYYMLIDFEKVISYAIKNSFTKSDIELVNMIMDGYTDVKYLSSQLNSQFEFKKPLKDNDVKMRLEIHIPKILFKANNEVEGVECSEQS